MAGSIYTPKSIKLWLIGMLFILSACHLYTMDFGATHAATAIHKEQQFSGGFVQLQRFTQQVGTEVEHQDGVARNVLVVSLPHKLQLQGPKRNISMSARGAFESLQSKCE